jgi:hypothetical protein
MRQSAFAALILLAAVPGVAPARSDVVAPPGSCVATATWAATGVTKTSTALTSDDVIEIPRASVVSWKGGVTGVAPGASRHVAGHVALRLPPPLGSIDLADWGGSATATENTGTYRYDLPTLVPSGVVLDLEATHDENGRRHCAARVGVVIPGGPFDSPLIWAALGGVALFGALLVFSGVSRTPPGPGRITVAALLGVPFGLFLGLSGVLFGLFALASPVVTLMLPLGAAAGGLWARWSPLGRAGT